MNRLKIVYSKKYHIEECIIPYRVESEAIEIFKCWLSVDRNRILLSVSGVSDTVKNLMWQLSIAHGGKEVV
jgi:hypothetical protein